MTGKRIKSVGDETKVNLNDRRCGETCPVEEETSYRTDHYFDHSNWGKIKKRKK